MKEVTVIKKTKTIHQSGKQGKVRVAAYCRVSTDVQEQIDSFKSQVNYYNDKINANPNWINAGIYADEALSGTQAETRPEFQRMIDDAVKGKIDIIMVKSISRFARNTLDTLKYVRLLKDNNVAVLFEEENIDTLKASGELMLTILSSVAQQEVENTSEHVKKGLAMKMNKGELVGNNSCLGYDYDPKTKQLVINKKEAEVVRYIFKRYTEGVGATVLSRELGERGYVTKYGSSSWNDTTILGIIKNEKYKGDLCQGKTFTVDPISKRRLGNNGESEKYYVTEHHESIVSKEVWEKANQILKKRSFSRHLDAHGNRVRFSREFAFSSVLECGFCGRTLSRKHWRNGSYNKITWQCTGYLKKGKHACRYSKAIPEDVIQESFVELFNKSVTESSSFLTQFLDSMEDFLTKDKSKEVFALIKKKEDDLRSKKDRLTDLYVNGEISREDFEEKKSALLTEEDKLTKERADANFKEEEFQSALNSLKTFREKVLSTSQGKISEFDQSIFDTLVDKVIVGGKDEKGEPDSFALKFILKSVNSDSKQKVKEKKLFDFYHYWRHVSFTENGKHERLREISDCIKVIAVISL